MMITMQIQLTLSFLIVSAALIDAFVCPTSNGLYPHEWNKAAYYRCVGMCAYLENCPPNSYYSSSTNKCAGGQPNWRPQFDLTGRYNWHTGDSFIDIRQPGYDVQWTSGTETDPVFMTFIGRYLNQTMVTGIEIIAVKNTSCIALQDLDLSVSGKRSFCRHRVAWHWYTRECGVPLSPNQCHNY